MTLQKGVEICYPPLRCSFLADDGELTAGGTALNLCLGCDGYGIVVAHVLKCGFDCFHTSFHFKSPYCFIFQSVVGLVAAHEAFLTHDGEVVSPSV